MAQPSPQNMFTLRRVGNAAMVILSCPAVREWQALVLTNYLAEVVEHNQGRVVLDITDIFQFTCSWLKSLITLSDRARELGGRFIIVGMSRQGRQLMKEGGWSKRLELAESGEQALTLVGAAATAPWRRAVARLLSFPTGRTGTHKPKAA
jgi:anti-anti-sigma regulatory factor